MQLLLIAYLLFGIHVGLNTIVSHTNTKASYSYGQNILTYALS